MKVKKNNNNNNDNNAPPDTRIGGRLISRWDIVLLLIDQIYFIKLRLMLRGSLLDGCFLTGDAICCSYF